MFSLDVSLCLGKFLSPKFQPNCYIVKNLQSHENSGEKKQINGFAANATNSSTSKHLDSYYFYLIGHSERNPKTSKSLSLHYSDMETSSVFIYSLMVQTILYRECCEFKNFLI